ncbi:uncharacterized protein LOC129615916 [Condylostylus longicornis]|uniref:uncharacterized protein LOC129615916 n=1 Tax=Condylostylus longicornis TaxID=2530218 RepID=UPI00244DFD28|nr:uncharacterized protein LOC129615916 [Condylostylus longicornis]XP_055387311.1 uncharacterized protein LOC129615916 [Condylostylus longicornis]XP_055387312.1 uncharacterized protein LOC129615916 [Condylostylus longicornis]
MTKLLIITLLTWFQFTAYADEINTDTEWKGIWFPRNPYDENLSLSDCQSICDNGHNCLQTDLDENKHKALWTCEDNRTFYEGRFDLNPLYTEFDIPVAYVPQALCMNESIYYGEELTAFGNYRPVWASYGEYTYLPQQRYMHNLDFGAVVALYHPCANRMQIKSFKSIVASCLFRHLISPSRMLTKERPFALLVWGKSLEMPIVEPFIIRDFIKKEAIKTPKNIYSDGNYQRLLIKPANLVTDEKDSELCPID